MPIIDQRTDRSGAFIVKLASRLTNQKLAGSLVDLFFSPERQTVKTASEFPVGCADDVRLSRLYFEGQREKLAAAEAEAFDKKISVHEVLYGLTNEVEFKPATVKVAAETAELLPMVKVANSEELLQAGSDFSRDFQNLSFENRVTFSLNFVKCAELNDVDIPEDVKIYACRDVVPNKHLSEYLHLRKVACDRMGQDGSAYVQLAEALTGAELSTEELQKIACAVFEADVEHGFTDRRWDRRIPDAWHSVCACEKKAEELPERVEETMDKADIVARFGDGALDAVEMEDGTVDQQKLRNLIAMFRKENPKE